MHSGPKQSIGKSELLAHGLGDNRGGGGGRGSQDWDGESQRVVVQPLEGC